MATTMVMNEPEHQRGCGTRRMGNQGRHQFDRKDHLIQRILRKFAAAWPLVLFVLLPALTHAETALQAWVQRYDGPGSGSDYAYAIAVDGSNNVIVTGYTWDNTGFYNYATIKYSASGLPLWTNRYNGPGNGDDVARAVAVDCDNNVIVTGWSLGNGSSSDYATLKYSSAGVPLWTNRYDGPGNCSDAAVALAVDGSNNVIVTGYSCGNCYDYATLKYSSAGVPLWTNRYSGPGNNDDRACAVAVDHGGNVIVTGHSFDNASSYDYATLKYSSVGVPLWTNRYNGPGNAEDYAFALVVDSGDNVIVTGDSTNSASGFDYATLKYSSVGVPLWTNLYNGPGNGHDYAYAVAAGLSNQVIVAGSSIGSGGNYDYATIQYSSAGVPLWTNRYNGIGNVDDKAFAMAVDRANDVVVTGYSGAGGGYWRYATIKYSGAGVPLWTQCSREPENRSEAAYAVVVDSSNNVIVTGASSGSAGYYDFATIKYVSVVPPPVIASLQLTNQSFQMRVDDVLQACRVVVEASTNLASWVPVFTNTTPTNVVFYTDPSASNSAARFYRAFQSP